MSLFVPTEDGLLGTHVTWHDVETALQACFRTNAHFGGGKKVTNIGEMKGFLSRIALIEPDWQPLGSNIASGGVVAGGGLNVEPPPTEHEKQLEKLPEKLVVKIASQLALIEIARVTGNKGLEEVKVPLMEPVTRMFHDREIRVYAMLQTAENPRIPHPKMYCSKPFNPEDPTDLKAFIVFEHIPNRPVPVTGSISADALLPAIRAIASLSALGQKLTETELEFVGSVSFWEQILDELNDQKSVEKTCTEMKNVFPVEHREKCDKMLEIYRKTYTELIFMKKLSRIPDFLGHKPVLGHCDLWNSNLLFDENSRLKAIIDFQTVSWCSPGMDLSRLFACLLSPTERREKTRELLEEYYSVFVEELAGEPAPYTLQQLLDSYALFFPVMGMVIIPGIGAMMSHEGAEPGVDKMIGLMEDVIEVHEENLKAFPLFYENE